MNLDQTPILPGKISSFPPSYRLRRGKGDISVSISNLVVRSSRAAIDGVSEIHHERVLCACDPVRIRNLRESPYISICSNLKKLALEGGTHSGGERVDRRAELAARDHDGDLIAVIVAGVLDVVVEILRDDVVGERAREVGADADRLRAHPGRQLVNGE